VIGDDETIDMIGLRHLKNQQKVLRHTLEP
jgi:hypothetical protein